MPEIAFSRSVRLDSTFSGSSKLQPSRHRRRSAVLHFIRSWLNCMGLKNVKVGPVEESYNGLRKALAKDVVTTAVSVAIDPDQLIPLSEKEFYLVMNSWKPVQKELDETGRIMFLKMFERSPAVVTTFEKFRSLGETELETSNIFEVHGMVVMNAFDEIMCNLDDEQLIHELMLEQGRSHARFGDVMTEDIFWAMEEPFIMAVGKTLGGFTSSMEKIYRKIANYILCMCVVGFRQEMATRFAQASKKNSRKCSLAQGQIPSCSSS